jgi:REP element-mobilizing transposase RayT
MARKDRVHCPGGVYHVIARGVRRERIFYRPEEFRAYLDWVHRACQRYGVRVVAYVLMPNHVHLLVRISEVPLGRAMQFLQSRFARWYNRRYGYTGHLFQGRYLARLCTDERYLWALARYIHENPVRAGLVDSAREYPWSSLKEYAERRWEVVHEEEAMALLGPADLAALAGF